MRLKRRLYLQVRHMHRLLSADMLYVPTLVQEASTMAPSAVLESSWGVVAVVDRGSRRRDRRGWRQVILCTFDEVLAYGFRTKWKMCVLFLKKSTPLLAAVPPWGSAPTGDLLLLYPVIWREKSMHPHNRPCVLAGQVTQQHILGYVAKLGKPQYRKKRQK